MQSGTGLKIMANAVAISMNDSLADETSVEPRSPESVILAINSPLTTLLDREDSTRFMALWNKIQIKFDDDPLAAVKEANGLVSEIVQQISQMPIREPDLIEGQWKPGKDISPEDLQVVFKHYSSLVNQLVVL
jgi:hypothetical protein